MSVASYTNTISFLIYFSHLDALHVLFAAWHNQFKDELSGTLLHTSLLGGRHT